MSISDAGLLRAHNLTATVNRKEVIKGVDLQIEKGEIHALFGDDSDTKSMLIKVLSGELPVSGGSILFDNIKIRKLTPNKAIALGIETIRRNVGILLNRSVLENIFCNRYIRKNIFFIDRNRMKERIAELFHDLSFDIELDEKAKNLTMTQRKIVEIAKCVCSTPKLLLVDEYDIGLAPEIIEKIHYLFTLLAQGGTSILYSSNNIDTIFSICTRISIMKNGYMHKTLSVSDIDRTQLVQYTYSSIFSRKELEKSNFELFYLRNIYESIIDSIPFPIIVTDTRGHIIILNKKIERLLKLNKTQILYTPFYEIFEIDQETKDQIKENILHINKIQYFNFSSPIQTHVFPFFDEEHSYLGLIVIFQGGVETENVDEKIRGQVVNRIKEQQTFKIFHEIKNPLGIISNYLRLIRDEHSVVQIKNDALIIQKEVSRISRLLEDLPSLEKRVKTLQSTTNTKVSLLVQDTVDLLNPVINQRNITITLNFAYDPILSYNQDLLKQVVLNLAINGIEAVSDGGELAISSLKKKMGNIEYLVFHFRDNGSGIDNDTINKIFDPFYTTKNDHDNRGFGLTISNEIIVNFKGFIKVESVPLQGSDFSVFLPSRNV